MSKLKVDNFGSSSLVGSKIMSDSKMSGNKFLFLLFLFKKILCISDTKKARKQYKN